MENNSQIAPVESTLSELPFNSLSWEVFERLCRDLTVEYFTDHLINVRIHLSRGHKQDGIDISGFHKVYKKYVHIQAKNYEKFAARNITSVVKKFEEGEHYEDCKIFVLAVSVATVNRTYEQELKEITKRFLDNGKEFILWDSTALNLILTKYAQIVFDTFDKGDIDRPYYIKAFNGTRAFQDIIIRPKRKLYICPEHYVSRLLLYEDKSVIKKCTLIEAIKSSSDNILLKSAATIGKTVELEYLAHHFSVHETDSYFPILISLKNYVNQSIDELLKDNFDIRWKQISPTQLLVILDGFDEIKSEERDTFLRYIDAFIVSNPLVRIVLSSRANFITGNTTLESFKDYTLNEFGADEIQLFVSKTLDVEHHIHFFAIIEKQSISQWINSPYNLANFVKLYKINPNKLPQTRVELISSILESHYQRDFKKSRIDAVQQLQRRSIIQKLALSYNLFGVNSVCLEELLSIFDNEAVEIIKSTSFIKFSETSIIFNHNVLQEFLAAKFLSSKGFNEIIEIICFKPNYTKIKPKWFNTVALLIDILSNNPQRLQEIVKFICEKEHTLLKEVEYSFFSTSLKREIFKILAVNSDRIYGHFLYEDKIAQICSLCDDEDILDYLLMITKTADGYNLHIYLRLLMELEGVLVNDYEDEIKEVLFSILDNIKSDNKAKSLVYQVLTRLKILDSTLANRSLINLQNNQDYDFIDKVIGYLNLFPNHEDFIEVYLDVLSDWQQRKIIGITPNIFKGILQFQTPVALHKIITFLDDQKNKIFHRDYVLTQSYYRAEGFFKILARNLSYAYKIDKVIFEKVLYFLKNVSTNGYEREIKELFKFFFLTKTNRKAFWLLWRNRSGKYFPFRYMAALLFDEIILKEILKNLKEGELENDELWEVIHGLNQAGEFTSSEYLREEANKISRNYFQYEEKVNYQAVQDERIRRDVELLLSKNKFKMEVEAVFIYLGKDTISVDEIFTYEGYWRVSDNNIMSIFLRKWCKRLQRNVTKTELLQSLEVNEKAWRKMIIEELSTFDKKYFDAKAISYIQSWSDETALTLDLTNQIQATEDGFRIRNSESIFFAKFFLKDIIQVEKEKQLELLCLDVITQLMSQNRDNQKNETITEKVIRLQGEDMVKTQLLKKLADKTTSIVVLENHVEWCKRLKLEEAVPLIVDIIKRYPQRESYLMSSMVNTYCELGGDISSLKFILEQFNKYIDFHWLVLQKMVLTGRFKQKVKKILIDNADVNETDENLLKVANLLMEIGEVEGLVFFIKWYKTQAHLPDSWFSPSLVTFQFNAVFPMLYDLLCFVVGKKLDSTRGNNPIREILISLKPIAFRNEEDFMKCMANFTSLSKSDTVLEENIYSLKSSIYNFESEYYLEKREFEEFRNVAIFFQSYH